MESTPTYIFSKEKSKNEHGEVPTYIFTKEKQKNEHGEYAHVHFQQRETEKWTWRVLPRTFWQSKPPKMNMESTPYSIVTNICTISERVPNLIGGPQNPYPMETTEFKESNFQYPQSFS